jgi:DNA-binding transcriptional ArsR family regulator
MGVRPDIVRVAAVVGDPARARMLMALMDGRALTATELALEAGVAPSTASTHLAQLTSADLIALTRQGRHRYFRIVRPDVAAMLEGLMNVAAPRGRRTRPGPHDEDLRRARVCYDHLAGAYGVRLLERLQARGFVRGSDAAVDLTRRGALWAAALGIDVAALRGKRRPLCRGCLDWSERRMHLAGAFGAALLDRLLAMRYARRETGTRGVTFSPRGTAFLEALDAPGFSGERPPGSYPRS